MKKIAIGGLLALAAIIYPWHADAALGDNYATIVKLYGKRGVPTKDRWVYWAAEPNTVLSDAWMQFKDNHVVAINYKATNSIPYAESEIWRAFVIDSSGKHWVEYTETLAETGGARWFHTDDWLMYGRVTKGGTVIEICYKSWIDRNVGWSKNNEAKPPVEEGNADSAPSPSPSPDNQPRRLGKGAYGV
jgi:hypothetical protein